MSKCKTVTEPSPHQEEKKRHPQSRVNGGTDRHGKMIPRKCPYYDTIKCAQSFETEKERLRYEKRNCIKSRYLNCNIYALNFFEDFFESIAKADPERIRNFTKSVGAVVLEKIVKRLAKDELG